MQRPYKFITAKTLPPKRANFVVEYTKDFATRRAAEASGFSPDMGYKLLEEELIQDAIQEIVIERVENAGIDAQWLLQELVDNHRIARQMGNISASNTSLKIIAQLAVIDAMAKQKVELDVISDKELMERLQRGRLRLKEGKDEEVTFI